MNQLTALMLAIPDVLHAMSVQAACPSRNALDKRASRARQKERTALTREQDMVAARAAWLAIVLECLSDGDAWTTQELGEEMDTTRPTAYHRLVVMEDAGHIKRIGSGTSTRWTL